jgi:hypothetical protein
MRIEVLYFDGCPNHETLLPRLRELMDRAGIAEEVRLRRVESIEDAERERFLGSPTLRIDGRDVEPGADERRDFGLKCRLYRSAFGPAGMPADDWVLSALGVARPASRREASVSPAWASQRVAGLGTAERGLHRRILRSFAEGMPPTAEQLHDWATADSLDIGEAMVTLDSHDLVHRDPVTGAIAVAYPFSSRPTAHRVRLAQGVEVFAMCAIDALGIAFMLDTPAMVLSTDPGTNEPIEVSVKPTGESEWVPREAVVVIGCVGDGDSAECSCPHVNFAASPERGRALLDTVAGCAGDVLPMPDAIKVGRDVFGALLA